MKEDLDKILKELESIVNKLDQQLCQDGLPKTGKIQIKVLGQASLLLDESINKKLNIIATNDLDALLEGDSTIKFHFKEILRSHGYDYDELSKEIWIPTEAKFWKYYSSKKITVHVIDSFSTLVSKAKFAPEKNKQLLIQAIAEFSVELEKLFLKYKISLEEII